MSYLGSELIRIRALNGDFITKSSEFTFIFVEKLVKIYTFNNEITYLSSEFIQINTSYMILS